ncbi:MAG: MFS transporter [Steroidobacteraceae bacterium]
MTSRSASPWWFVTLLSLAAVLSIIDRGIINLVVDPLRAELGLSEVQVGALQGLAFGMIYAVGGLLLGMWVDRGNRRNLVIFGISVWSLATVAAGLARGFGEMFAARLIVGLGEAALAPAAISLIADLFPPHRRARPTGVFMAAQGVAFGIAISLTGMVIAAAAGNQFAVIGLPATLSPWRITFVLCGAAGFVLVLALATCREPARNSRDGAPDVRAQARAALRHGRDRWRFLLPLYLGFAVCFMAVYGAAGWNPTMLMRGFALTPSDLSATLGPLMVVFAAAGPLIGGAIIDPIVRRGGDRARLKLVAAVTLLAIPSGLATLAPSSAIAIGLVASGSAIYPFVGLGVLTCLQSQLPADMRGLGVAVTGLLNTFIGAIGGPLLIAWITERLLADTARVGESISFLVVPCLLLASTLFMVAARALPAEGPGEVPTGRVDGVRAGER